MNLKIAVSSLRFTDADTYLYCLVATVGAALGPVMSRPVLSFPLHLGEQGGGASPNPGRVLAREGGDWLFSIDWVPDGAWSATSGRSYVAWDMLSGDDDGLVTMKEELGWSERIKAWGVRY